MNAPILIAADIVNITKTLVADYESRVGKTLHPSQPESIIFDTISYQIYLMFQQFNTALQQMLIPFSNGPIIDYVVSLVGVTRLAAAPAQTTIRFSIVAGSGDIIIPSGTRVASVDGQAIFATTQDIVVLSGTLTSDNICVCQTAGIVGNNYAPGAISVILDPQAYLAGASNLDTTSGGSDQETDDQLRERAMDAPNSFSVAGPTGAYEFFAKSAHPSIVDVKVPNPPAVPGTVQVYVLVSPPATTPTQILNSVSSALSPANIRPLTDTVVTLSPTIVNYSLVIGITAFNEADPTSIIDQATAAVTAYTDAQAKKLGADVVGASIISACMVPGVYKPNLNGFNDVIVDDTQVAVCTSITITITGTTNG